MSAPSRLNVVELSELASPANKVYYNSRCNRSNSVDENKLNRIQARSILKRFCSSRHPSIPDHVPFEDEQDNDIWPVTELPWGSATDIEEGETSSHSPDFSDELVNALLANKAEYFVKAGNDNLAFEDDDEICFEASPNKSLPEKSTVCQTKKSNSTFFFRSPPARVPTISVHLPPSATNTPDSLNAELVDVSTRDTDSWVTVGGRGSLVARKIQALVEAFANRAQSVKSRIAQPPTPSPSPPPDNDEEQPDGRPRLESLIHPGSEADHEEQSSKGCGFIQIGRFKLPFCPKVLDPQSRCYISWLFLVALCYSYNAWFILLRSVFPYETDETRPYFMAADYFCDFIYLLDVIYIKVRIRYLENGLWMEELPKTTRYYVKQPIFKMDVLSLLPLDLLYFVVGVKPILRFPRLLKIQTFWEFFQRVDAVAKTPFVIRIIHTLLYMMFLIHANSCAYYAMSTYEGIGTNTWVYNGVGNAYIRCFYFATKTATSIGRNPRPLNDREYGFMTISWLMGVFVFAFLIGQIRDIVATATQSKNQYRQLMDQSVRYLRNLDLPEDLQRRVRLWLNHTWEQQKTFNEAHILDSLPIKMKTDVAISVHYNTLAKVQIFKDCDRSFLRDLVHKIKPVLFLPQGYICKKGEIGKEMYIVNNGQVEVVGGENNDLVLATLKEGSVFGEISLLGLDGYTRRTADVRSKGYSNLFVLSKDDLWEALKTYPEAEAILKRKAKCLIQNNKARADASKVKKNSIHVQPVITDKNKRPPTPKLIRTVMRLVPKDSECAKLLSRSASVPYDTKLPSKTTLCPGGTTTSDEAESLLLGVSVTFSKRAVRASSESEAVNRRSEKNASAKGSDFTSGTYFRDKPDVKQHREEDKRAEMTVLDLTTANQDDTPEHVAAAHNEDGEKEVNPEDILQDAVIKMAEIAPENAQVPISTNHPWSLNSSLISLRSFFRSRSPSWASSSAGGSGPASSSRASLDYNLQQLQPPEVDEEETGLKRRVGSASSWPTVGYDNLTFLPNDVQLGSRRSSLISDISF